MPVRILLVRHGQSEWNALGRWQGQADPPLSDLGRLQAHAAAHALGAVGAVFASDLVRAAETAAIIAAELGVGPVVIDADLRERDAG
ncbi:MAG: glucosyl-3-phosphoglycerate phosphatase, partial [Acidimicrobiaceae bacterium]